MNGVGTIDLDGLDEGIANAASATELADMANLSDTADEVGDTAAPKPAMSEHEAVRANNALVEHMNCVLDNSLKSAIELRHKLKHTYWIVIGLSLVMFTLGMVLISTPIWAPWLNTRIAGAPFDTTAILTTVGVGIADLIALFLFGPIARIQKLMGSFSQLTVGLETYQMQVAIRLIEADSNDRPTLGAAADHVAAASIALLDAITKYYAADLTTARTTDLNREEGGPS